LSPNKTLAAQLYEEFLLFFPENKVCYFVSYYDYYQPESYLPAQDIYIPKEKKVNSEIDRLRVEATASLLNRPDTIVIASVSCIYSLGDPHDYKNLALPLSVGQVMSRADLIRKLVFIQYARNEVDKGPRTFQVFGNTVEVQIPYDKGHKLRIELFDNTIARIEWVTRHNNTVVRKVQGVVVFPAKHFVSTKDKQEAAYKSIEQELAEYTLTLSNPLYRERIAKRVTNDLEMMKEVGYCSGIENYSIHFDGRKTGEKPFCLFDFFPRDFLLVIDESHIAVPQLRGMYSGDKVRKKSLIDFGFRLPSAYDNRPLMFEETESYFNDVIFVSATPGPYELEQSEQVVEQIIRPTGLVDPKVRVQSRIGQLDHLVDQIKQTRDKGYRTLVTVLTKRLAEELAEYLEERGIKVCYLHSDLKTPKRTELLQKLRLGVFDCLVGINLLREGLDLPEVALVAILDADVESFLRDKRSLIQTIGRAARNTESQVVMYADKITKSMRSAIDETERRRIAQQIHNKKHNITPQTVVRDVKKSITNLQEAITQASKTKKKKKGTKITLAKGQLPKLLKALEKKMNHASQSLDFESAIALRDEYLALKEEYEKL
jgi:excinuclease ABC subunit B